MNTNMTESGMTSRRYKTTTNVRNVYRDRTSWRAKKTVDGYTYSKNFRTKREAINYIRKVNSMVTSNLGKAI